jgi:hypothetical protein
MAAISLLLFPTAAFSELLVWETYNTSNSGIPDDRVVSVGIDLQGDVWTAHSSANGIGSGCAKFDGEEWTVYNTKNSGLPHDNASAFAFDQQGNVWIGTGSTHSSGGGLAKFDGANWTKYNAANSGLPHDNISRLAFGPDGNLWIASAGGIAKFDGETWITYNTANSGLPSNTVFDFAFDSQGNLWAGTWGGGLARFDGENWTAYDPSNSGQPSRMIVPVAVDSEDNVWIGTYEGSTGPSRGLVKFDGENWTVYNTQTSGLPSDAVWSLAVDGQDNVWAGAGSLVKFDGQNWTVHSTSSYFIYVDDLGNIWNGTGGSGLVVARPVPVVDFDGDEIVDIDDLLILIEHWGTDESLCDIGPLPWGDGAVDFADLEVLMSHWQQEVLPVSLLAYWKLDEIEGDVAYDSTSQNDAIVMGNAVWQSNGGQVGGALQLDGIDDYVSSDSILNPVDGAFSVVAWAKGGAPGQVILAQESGRNWLMADTVDGLLRTDLTRPETGGRGGSPGPPLISHVVVTGGDWHRVVFVRDGVNRILYVDGVEVARDAAENLESADGGLYIGAGSALQPGTLWVGLIDDVRIYDVALTPEDVMTLMR